MRHYEIVLLVHPDQSEQAPGMLDRYQEMVSADKGRVHRVEDWGRRRLAYMIGNVHKAHYLMLNVECALDTLRELEKSFKFNDSILRSLVIRRDQAFTEESAMAHAKAEEERVEAEKQAAARQKAESAAAAAAAAEAKKEAEAGKEAEAAEVAEVAGAVEVAAATEPPEAAEPETEPAESESDSDSKSDSEPEQPENK